MKNSPGPSYKKERFVWISVSLVLVAALAVIAISPTVFAQSKQDDTRLLMYEFERVFQFVLQNYVDDVDPEVLMEGAMEGLFNSLDDPHSAYLNQDAMRDLNDTTAGEFGGVGIYISKATPDSEAAEVAGHTFVEVISPIEDTPAFKAGILAGDLITHIEEESTEALTSDEVVQRLRGTPGSEVKVTIKRGENLSFNVSLSREIIQIPTVKQAVIPGNIGYVRIIQFTPYTSEKVEEALKSLEQEGGYRNLIIDLRSNPGGLLSSVVKTADLFFDDGVIVSTKSRLPYENSVLYAGKGQAVADDVPIIVLIDKGSASAAEILAGALKDRDRAVLVGETTYGKGSVQQVHSLGKTGFRLTMSRYYTPADVSIDKVGIEPDRKVEIPVPTEEEAEAYVKLLEQNRITDFVLDHPEPSDEEISSFIGNLDEDGIVLQERIIRRMIRDEVHRKETAPVYDLEYDLVLQEAVKMLQENLVTAEGR